MVMAARWIVFAVLLMAGASAVAYAGDKPLDFTVHKLESGKPGCRILVVGGIQGDEPGGFNAAALLVTHYQITKGALWVVPNLNFISIINRHRGVYGDMNRKFAAITATDPEAESITKIKALIVNESIDVVLNLHDGGGFYRPQYVDALHNPDRWGQSIIIDQERINHPTNPELRAMADKVIATVNRHALNPGHRLNLHNTRTAEGNEEMAKTLSYFAIAQGKPAFGLEASKSLLTPARTFYHLHMVEAFMQLLGVQFHRPFPLTLAALEKAIDSNVQIALFDGKMMLDMCNARNQLNYIPFESKPVPQFFPSNPLIAMLDTGKGLEVRYGNRRVTVIQPQYFEFDRSIDSIAINVDGKKTLVAFGRAVKVRRSFTVQPIADFRVNVIGFRSDTGDCESNAAVSLADLDKDFSLDKDGKRYRVEVYRGKSFAGMVLVDFSIGTTRLSTPAFDQVPPMQVIAYHQAIVPEAQNSPPARPDNDGL